MAVTEAPAEPRPRRSPAPRRDGGPGGPPPGPARPPRRARREPRGDLALTLGVAAATLAALLPISRLIVPSWFGGAVLIVVLVLLAGYALRRAGLPGVLAAAGELATWAVCATVALGHEDALLGLLPTPAVVRSLPELFDVVSVDIVEGVAPLDPGPELAFVLVAAAGLLAFCVGHIVRATRLPLLAALVLITVFVVPQLAVPGDPDLVAAVLLISAILWLVRTEIRSRRPGSEAGPVASSWAGVLGIGAVLAAVILAPGVPLSAPAGGGVGRTTSISASLDLGDDLRRPADVEVLRLRTDASSAPYLRVATLTRFDGQTWQPDATPRGDLSFRPLQTTAEGAERVTSVEVTRLSSAYLPVPYPATEVTGVVGQWMANPLNRTVLSTSTTALGQRYQVRSQDLQPSLEQARSVMPRDRTGFQDFWANPADQAEFSFEALALPDDAVAADLRARTHDVIGEAGNAYDALVAMQSWFRTGGGFEYSLDAPVEEGFDGSGMDAIRQFLEVRSGYCVHFASTFAVMARSIGIPARVVVGFLPGTATGEEIDDQGVYSVLGSQLHAWPEAYLDGIGWVPFEPTASLGTPTTLRSEAAPGAAPSQAPEASAAPTPTPSASRELDRGDAGDAAPTTAGVSPAGVLRGLGLALAAIGVLALPAAIRGVRGSLRRAAARRGDAGAAWRELQDLVIDAGLSVDESESPRVFAARLSHAHAVPASALAPLVAAIEDASFSPAAAAPTVGEGAARDLGRALAQTRAALFDGGGRLRATLMPRSLAVRPRVAGR
jgi:transglutaminase-like putative cysteine protease